MEHPLCVSLERGTEIRVWLLWDCVWVVYRSRFKSHLQRIMSVRFPLSVTVGQIHIQSLTFPISLLQFCTTQGPVWASEKSNDGCLKFSQNYHQAIFIVVLWTITAINNRLQWTITVSCSFLPHLSVSFCMINLGKQCTSNTKGENL